MNTPQFDPHTFDFDALEKAEAREKFSQRTPEWYAARRGRFTGSEIWKLMTEPRSKAAKDSGELSDTAMSYIYEKLAEIATDLTPEVFSTSMQWGLDHEAEAMEVYKTYFSESIDPCDFIPYGDFGGGSPDGFIGDKGIAEVKCPYNSGGHIENMKLAHMLVDPATFKEYHKEYYWQQQNNLMVTDREFSRFISYDPRFKDQSRIACVTLTRVETDIDQIRKNLARATVIMVGLKAELGL